MNHTRRTLLRIVAGAAAALPLLQFALPATLRAAQGERLSPDDPAAESLAYSHQSSDPSRRCSGCQFYKGTGGEDWGPCVIFPGKLVSADGICNSWRARSG